MNRQFKIDSSKIINYGEENLKIVPHGHTGYTGGNEMVFLRAHNPIRNYKKKSFDFIKTLNVDFTENHRFQYVNITEVNGEKVYKIRFEYIDKEREQKKDVEELTASSSSYGKKKYYFEATGFIYINGEDYTINKLDYKVYLFNNYIKTRKKLWELNLEYRKYDDKSYLNYISFNNQIEIPQYGDDSYLYVKNVLIDKEQKEIQVQFNNKLKEGAASNKRNYKLELKQNKLQIEEIRVNDNIVSIEIKDFDLHFKNFRKKDLADITVEVKNVRDHRGNKVNDIKTLKAYQYRELFVNNVSTKYTPLDNQFCLDKHESIILFQSDSIIKNEVIFNSPLLD